jgi:hypothetical protein
LQLDLAVAFPLIDVLLGARGAVPSPDVNLPRSRSRFWKR